jgi:hypothetical protein
MKQHLLTLLIILVASLCKAQTNVDQKISASNFAGAYASFINFATEPDISAAKLNVDDGDSDGTINVFKLPLRHEFTLNNSDWKPVIQGTLAYLKSTSSFPVFGTEAVDASWTTYSAAIGGGVRIPLSEHWSILPALDGGYAYIKSDADYGPLGEALLKPALEGKLFGWEAHALMVNAHLALLYNQTFQQLEIDAHLGGTISYIDSFKTTSALQDFAETVGTVSIKADATHPLGFSIWNYPIFGVGHLGHSSLISDQDADLGISSLNEAGFSLKADISHHSVPVKSLSLGAMVLWGPNVSGWKILMGYQF